VFHEDSNIEKKYRYIPYEIKEACVKNSLGFLGIVTIDFFFPMPAIAYSLGTGFFAFNWLYTVSKPLINSITRMDLHEDGEHVTVWFKLTGSQKTLKI